MVTWNQTIESVYVSLNFFITTKEVGQYHQPVLATLRILYFSHTITFAFQCLYDFTYWSSLT